MRGEERGKAIVKERDRDARGKIELAGTLATERTVRTLTRGIEPPTAQKRTAGRAPLLEKERVERCIVPVLNRTAGRTESAVAV